MGGDVTKILISCKYVSDSLVIIYEDNGVGIPNRDKENIFIHGYGKNTGIGLFLAEQILSVLGLSIRECGDCKKGARFEITVPAGKFRRSR
jgi:signal transduction histidine kinase